MDSQWGELAHLLLQLWVSPWGLLVLGLCVGSFINVVVYRLPRMMERQWRTESAEMLGLEAVPTPPGQPADEGEPFNLARPRSRCPHCGHVLRWHENLPLLGWLRLRGRCAACHAPIGLRYPLVEATCGLLFAAVGWRFGYQASALMWCGVVAVLLTLSLIDWDTTLLPDSMTQPLVWAGLIAAAQGWTALSLSQSLWGAVIGYLSLWSIYWLFKLLTGKEGMGAGDFKLLAGLGAWLGPMMLLPIVLGASLFGAAVGILMKLNASLREGRYVPFGPFLAGGGAVVLFAGSEQVMRWMGWAA